MSGPGSKVSVLQMEGLKLTGGRAVRRWFPKVTELFGGIRCSLQSHCLPQLPHMIERLALAPLSASHSAHFSPLLPASLLLTSASYDHQQLGKQTPQLTLSSAL